MVIIVAVAVFAICHLVVAAVNNLFFRGAIMSFWGKVGELGKSAINATVDAAKEANAEKERYKDELRERNYSEAKLRELFRTTSSASRKMAIASIMRERGFSSFE